MRVLTAAALAALAFLQCLRGAEYPPGFVETRIASGITAATALAAGGDGRIFIGEQTGALRVVKEDQLLPRPFLRVEVDPYWERGLIGVALDPGFPETPHIYIVYVSPRPYPHHVVSRFAAGADAVVPGSEIVLLAGDDQRRLGGSIPAGHQGGGIRFGLDGMLYIGVGEQTAGSPSQRLDTFQGKLLRIGRDGSIPADNPFAGKTGGKYRAIWAIGLRNPFGLAVHPRTGRIFINDVGGAAWEEVNEGRAGADYGWPKSEGATRAPGESGPVHAYERSAGKSITGGAFYAPPARQFPAAFAGKYFFADFEGNWIHVLDPDEPRNASPFAAGLARPVAMAVVPDGSLLVLERNAWVNDQDLRPGTGMLSRVRFTGDPSSPAPAAPPRKLAARASPVAPPAGSAAPREPVTGIRVPADPAGLPALLSHTGLFRSVPGLIPSPGIVPYDVISPLWADGAFKRRWIALPGQGRIGFAPGGAWRFPPGTVFIKHFELGTEGAGEAVARKRLETRLLVVADETSGYGATYRWRADGSDADLLAESLTEELAVDTPRGREPRTWYYPGRKDCLTCHTAAAGFVLGVKTRQMNRPCRPGAGGDENQIRFWSRLGMFEAPIAESALASLDQLVALADEAAPLEARVRSYLDSNCANCHLPGGARGFLDARWETPLAEQNLIAGPLVSGDLEAPGSRVVVAGDVARSALHGRMNRFDVFKMPPLAMHRADEAALTVIAAWIRSLAVAGAVAAGPSRADAGSNGSPSPASLRVATFDIDATPPVGSFLAYDPVIGKWDMGLRARGIVLLGAADPIVLCAIDWIGIANEAHDVFRAAIASAAGTAPARVAVHTLHQHDAPDCDFSAEKILKGAGLDARQYEGGFQRQLLADLQAAIREALPKARPVTHLGLGDATVKEVASNRRLFGRDGKVRAVRYTACKDPDLRAEPEGTIDPAVSLVSFWNQDRPVAVLSYYATHPQSYYRTGVPNPDFPGLARFLRQLAVPEALHVHFNGAGGNVGAGKYNDGSPGNRLVLAERLADGMRRAWESTRREPLTPEAVVWGVEPVVLPPAKHLSIPEFEALVQARDPTLATKGGASRMAWLRRVREGRTIDIASLTLGRARILHMPGELFVEYQLAAKAHRPDLFVCMAAYGDYGPWYIGTAIAYDQGGYETSPTASNVAPEAEGVLLPAIRKLLGTKP